MPGSTFGRPTMPVLSAIDGVLRKPRCDGRCDAGAGAGAAEAQPGERRPARKALERARRAPAPPPVAPDAAAAEHATRRLQVLNAMAEDTDMVAVMCAWRQPSAPDCTDRDVADKTQMWLWINFCLEN